MIQVKHHSTTKFLLTVAILAIISACNSGEDKSLKQTTTAAVNFKLNCVILEKAQVQKWVDMGWTNPAKPDSLIKKVLLQFYSADAANANTNMQLATFPAKKYTNAYAAGREDAVIDPTCATLFPSGKIILGNNYISLKDLDILKPDGQLKDFTFIRLRPVQERPTYGDYIIFKWEVVRVGPESTETIINDGRTSDPCPTFCEEEGIGG